MADIKVVCHLLINNAPLIAVVPAAKIYSGVIPQGTPLPAISISHVSTVRRHPVAGTATELCTARVQVTAQAASYTQQKSVLALVRGALPRTRGTVNGIVVDSLMHEIDGPDFRDDDAGIFMGSVDYIVKFIE